MAQVKVHLAKYLDRHRTNRALCKILNVRKAFITAPSIGKNKHFHVLMFKVAANLWVRILGGDFLLNREKLLK